MPIYNQLTDEDLMHMLRSDDALAFAELYQRHWEQMAVHAMKVIHSREDARDIVQEVFVSLWKLRNIIELKGPLIVYLLRSARNGAIRHIECHITSNSYLKTLSARVTEGIAAPSSYCEYKELQQQVADAVAALPTKMQEVYLLSRNEKMSYKQIADHMGIAENTVRKQMSNALKSLRTTVSEHGMLFVTCITSWLF